MKTFDDSTLLPCPFCGSSVRRLHGYETGRVSCSNENCSAHGLQMWPKYWNTRALEAENAALRTRVAELEGLCKTYVEAIRVFIDGQEEGK
jgi:hypothetical protein